MNIIAENLGKRFDRNWLFRNLNLNFQQNKSYAITGRNGSGKSTLVQILAGLTSPNEGKVKYFSNNTEVFPEHLYQKLTFTAPYQDLIEELTLGEIIDFHLTFKKFKNNLSKKEFIQILGLEKSSDKQLTYFSSGMRQRVKLGFAMYTESEILFLDEPTVNLDSAGINWYKTEIIQNIKDRIVIICSNQPYEYDFCHEIIKVEDFHKS
jgi:ABC-type multidrug transport system ATPase subunit